MNMKQSIKTGMNQRNLWIIIAVIVVVAVSIILIVNNSKTHDNIAEEATLAEGQDYDIRQISGTKYEIIDDLGYKIELKRISDVHFLDAKGNYYKFITGSPYTFIGMEKKE